MYFENKETCEIMNLIKVKLNEILKLQLQEANRYIHHLRKVVTKQP